MRRESKSLLLLAALLLAGCNDPGEYIAYDQCKRRELFQQCLAAVPKGPLAQGEASWHKVISECEDAAMYQSRARARNVKPECAL